MANYPEDAPRVQRAIEQSLFAEFPPSATNSEDMTQVNEEPGFDSDDSAEVPKKEIPETPELMPERVLAPMLKHYCETKQIYPEHLLLFQVGDFYEVFFDDAKIAAEALGIRLTSRDRDEVNPIPMCGVPVHALDNYLPRLLKAGHSCVVMSQVEEGKADGKSKKGPIRREISRIVTPGVRFEGDGLDESRFNYLASVCVGSGDAGAVCFADVSTGRLRVAEAENIEALEELLRRVGPVEMILPSTLFDIPVQSNEAWLRMALQIARSTGARVVKRPFARISRAELQNRVIALLVKDSGAELLKGQLEALAPATLAAVAATIGYVEEVSFTACPRLSDLSIEQPERSVLIDAVSRANLELTQSRLTGERKNSLVAGIDYTRTAMGARMLAERLVAPSRDIAEINARHDVLSEMTARSTELDELRQLLVGVRDLDRLVSRITSGRANPIDLRMLADSIADLPCLSVAIKSYAAPILAAIAAEFDALEDIWDRIDKALLDNPPLRLNEGGIFKDGCHPEVDRLRAVRGDGRNWLMRLEAAERERTGITGLKVKFNNVFGYFIEISKAHMHKAPPDYERKQTLANAERFVTRELKEQEVLLLGAKARQIELERELFVDLRNWIAEQSGRIQITSRMLAELDVFASFAFAALKHNYCRPVMRTDQEYIVRSGRHPVVEQVLGAHNFVPNDAYLNGGERRFAILTGPNMGGKSTYLRQVGLIQLLAQAGSFVPAESAELGVVDRIFTRIGAADDLTRGDSTFMVEMREAAIIVRRATSRSLVLIDEVGRGTATSDGLAIATAVAEWLHDRVGCRTVFATHFHQLTGLSGQKSGAFCLSVGVVEHENEISFTHRIEERAADKSYGIEVARLAGLPEALLKRAEAVMEQLDSADAALNQNSAAVEKQARPAPPAAQISAELRDVADRLQNCKPERITPLQALTELTELKALLERKRES